jgi:hypothetical protein
MITDEDISGISKILEISIPKSHIPGIAQSAEAFGPLLNSVFSVPMGEQPGIAMPIAKTFEVEE